MRSLGITLDIAAFWFERIKESITVKGTRKFHAFSTKGILVADDEILILISSLDQRQKTRMSC